MHTEHRYLTSYILLKEWETFFKALRGSGNLKRLKMKRLHYWTWNNSFSQERIWFQLKKIRNSEETETLYHFYMLHIFPPINWLKKQTNRKKKPHRSPYQSFMTFNARNPLTFLPPAAVTSSNFSLISCKAYLGSPQGFSSNCKSVYSWSFLQDQIDNNTTTRETATHS